MKKYLGVILMIGFAGIVNAQNNTLKGSVRELASGNKLSDVFVRDNATKEATMTEKDGSFAIKTAKGHILIFDCPGYISDTLYVIDMKAKRVDMKTMNMSLREVTINSTRSFDPRAEYPEVYAKSKVYVMSPSTWFSEEGKRARRMKKFFENEAQQRHIDEVYTRIYVGSIVPLKGGELENFMALYRPTYAFLRNNSGPSLVAFINDSYKKYQALPPDKRVPATLTAQTQ